MGNHPKCTAAADSDQSRLGESNSFVQYQICQAMEVPRIARIVRRSKSERIHPLWLSLCLTKVVFSGTGRGRGDRFLHGNTSRNHSAGATSARPHPVGYTAAEARHEQIDIVESRANRQFVGQRIPLHVSSPQ